MESAATLSGYLVYLAQVFVPGIGLSELLGVWEKEELVARIGAAFGLGLGADTVVFTAATSGLQVGGVRLAGLGQSSSYVLIGVGLISLVASIAWRKKFTFPARPRKPDLFVFALMLALAGMVALQFQKYPIFPEFPSADYANHVGYVQGLISGSQTSIPGGILYFGVEYQLASALLLVGGLPLQTLRWTMGVLVVLSPLLVYLGSRRLFKSVGAALVATTVYALTGTIWFVSVFDGGLFPNFFGILSLFFLLAALMSLFERPRSPGAWGAYLLALVMTYFSHYSAVTLLPALLAVPLVQCLRARSDVKRYLVPVVVALAPAGLAFAASPSLVSRLIFLAEQGGGLPSLTTPIAGALSAVPVLGYMAAETYGDVSFVFLVIFAAVFLYRMDRERMAVLLIPLFWLASLLVAAPLNVSAWRFSLEAIVPLFLMAGYGVHSVLPRLQPQRRRGRPSTGGYLKVGVVLVLLLIPVIAFSWGVTSVGDSLADAAPSASAQQDVYAAMSWLQANTSSSSTYLSVSDWRFSSYTDEFFGRATNFTFFSQPGPAVQLAREKGYGYVIVTFAVTASIPPDPSLFPWNNFKQSSNLTLQYSNPDVEIFKVV